MERAFWSAQSLIWDTPADPSTHRTRVGALRDWIGSALRTPARILDLGCATGEISVGFADDGYEVTALDFSPRMLRRGRLRPGAHAVRFLEADLAAGVPPHLGTFHGVLLLGVLQCVPDPAALVSSAAAHLEPGGLLFVDVPGSPAPSREGPGSDGPLTRLLRRVKAGASRSAWVHRFDGSGLSAMVEAAGLMVEAPEVEGHRLRVVGRAPRPGIPGAAGRPGDGRVRG